MEKKKGGKNRWDDIDGGSAFILPYTLLRSQNFRRLSPYAHKLIHDLACQYTGFNNGYLCASWTLMKDAGWGSPTTLSNAVNECEHYKLIVRTQQGGLNKPNLFGFTWRRIDEKKGKDLDVRPSIEAANDWKAECEPYVRTTGKRKSASRRRPVLRSVR